ncbi:MAG: hypothetical protein PHZ19_05005 [Candidatus Thermoplasmatota archaeon]|nr:hypothetical protein [Candidatus Thermoplasmatota archaeon]
MGQVTLRPTPLEAQLIEWHKEAYQEPTKTRTIFRALRELKWLKQKVAALEADGKKLVAMDSAVLEEFTW